MADPASYRPKTSDIPTKPGVYRFRDEHGRVIYVGKAKVLRNRLTSYFANPDRLTPKTRAMVFTAGSVEWTVVGSELEACSWSTPGSRNTTRASTSSSATTRPTRTWLSRSTRNTRGHW